MDTVTRQPAASAAERTAVSCQSFTGAQINLPPICEHVGSLKRKYCIHCALIGILLWNALFRLA